LADILWSSGGSSVIVLGTFQTGNTGRSREQEKRSEGKRGEEQTDKDIASGKRGRGEQRQKREEKERAE
jgi:hypothetical protein